MKFTNHHTNILLNLLRWRRDVRHFRPDPIDPDLLSRLEDAIALGPSVGNSQPWRIVHVKSQEVRRQVLESHQAANVDAATGYDRAKREKYVSLKLAGLRDAPVHLAVFTDLSPKAGDGLGRQTMPETLTYSTVIAIHTLWLVARSMNLGVGWVSILEPDKVHRCLDVDPEWHLTAYLCVGYPTFDDNTPELERKDWQSRAKQPWLIR
ncbi:MAG: 5,6-dimethylbenzimidazole synthase [Pseudomonadota bacterium]